LRIVALVPGHE